MPAPTTFNGDFGRLMQAFHTHVSTERHEAIVCRVPLPQEVLRPIFERAAATGEMRADIDPDLALALYFSMVLGHLKSPVGNRRALPPETDIAAAITEVMVHGIGPGSRRPAQARGKMHAQS